MLSPDLIAFARTVLEPSVVDGFAAKVAAVDRPAFGDLANYRDALWRGEVAPTIAGGPNHPFVALVSAAQDGTLLSPRVRACLGVCDLLHRAGHHALADDKYGVGRANAYDGQVTESRKLAWASREREELAGYYARIAERVPHLPPGLRALPA